MSAPIRSNLEAKIEKKMLSILFLVFTCLALFLIPCLFFFLRLKFPLSLANVIRIIKLTAPKYDNENRGPKEKKEKGARNGLPKHVAVILDGNRRWAKKRGLGAQEGHEAGGRRLIENCSIWFAMGVNTISLFAFSTENWGRPEDEVNYLMDLFETEFKSQLPVFQSNKIKISVIGNRSRIPESLLKVIEEVEEATKSYEGKHIFFAIDYSGRFDILQACKSLAKKAKEGLIEVEDINEKAMEKELMTNCSEFPNPDLLIRTSGEQRISNFFLWQSAYTELYFPTALWPDFGADEYLEALTWYQQRERRFGRRV